MNDKQLGISGAFNIPPPNKNYFGRIKHIPILTKIMGIWLFIVERPIDKRRLTYIRLLIHVRNYGKILQGIIKRILSISKLLGS